MQHAIPGNDLKPCSVKLVGTMDGAGKIFLPCFSSLGMLLLTPEAFLDRFRVQSLGVQVVGCSGSGAPRLGI